jgi:L-cysteate sulfo-lyase
LKTVENVKQKLCNVPRIRLLNLPTPLEEMPRLTKLLKGPRLWIKRDDCTGMAFGGNKERKTEFVMADALNRKADVVITTGATQSNHARATAAAARKVGLKSVLVLRGVKPRGYDGNLLLDYLLGADIRFISEEELSHGKPNPMEKIAEELKGEGHTPYIIPGGASYPVGATAYVNAMLELLEQAQEKNFEITSLVHASGSGGTQAGLVLANKALDARIDVEGICVEPNTGWLTRETVKIANGTAKLLKMDVTVGPGDVNLVEEYAGEYGTLTPEASEAIKLLAKTEGILLDPVYTGKAMAGLIDMIKHGRFKGEDNLVFIHTGGTPALFSYRKDLI